MFPMWKWVSDSFWTESLWLGSENKWSDVTNRPHKSILYPDTTDFWYHIILMVVFLIVKYALEKYCYEPLGQVMGIKNKKQRKVENIPLLETAYRNSPTKKDAAALAKQLDMSERQVERWWRLRKNTDKPTRLFKFREHAWKATYYGCNCLCGLYILWDKDYFWDLDKCYLGYPHQGITNDVWWFYAINIAYSWSSFITVFSEARRADFVPMIVHHALAGALLTISWVAGLYRIGTVLLPPLDGSEALLEVAKGLKSAKYEVACTISSHVFALAWFYARMYIYPFHVLYSTIITAPTIIPPFFVATFLVVMLLVLFVLQVYWTVLIVKVAYNFYAYGIKHDIRSSESEPSDCQLSTQTNNTGTSSLYKNDVKGHSSKQQIPRHLANGQ